MTDAHLLTLTIEELNDTALSTQRKREVAIERFKLIRASLPELLGPESNDAVRSSARDTEWVLKLFDLQDKRTRRQLAQQQRKLGQVSEMCARLLGYMQTRANLGDPKELLEVQAALAKATEVLDLDQMMDVVAMFGPKS